MGRYDTAVRCAQIRNLVEENQYLKAMEEIEDMDYEQIPTISDLYLFADVFLRAEKMDAAKELYYIAYHRTASRPALYRLLMLAIRMGDIEEAKELYLTYEIIAGITLDTYELRYRLAKASGEPREKLIDILEQLKKDEYTEEWGYQLARLYEQEGMREQCIRECEDLKCWFGSGTIVNKAEKLRESCLSPLWQKPVNDEIPEPEEPDLEEVFSKKRVRFAYAPAQVEDILVEEDIPVEAEETILHSPAALQKEVAVTEPEQVQVSEKTIPFRPKRVREMLEKPEMPEVSMEKPGMPEVAVEKLGKPGNPVEKLKMPEVAVEKPGRPEMSMEKMGTPEKPEERPGRLEMSMEKLGTPEKPEEKLGRPEMSVEKPEVPKGAVEKLGRPEITVEKPEKPEKPGEIAEPEEKGTGFFHRIANYFKVDLDMFDDEVVSNEDMEAIEDKLKPEPPAQEEHKIKGEPKTERRKPRAPAAVSLEAGIKEAAAASHPIESLEEKLQEMEEHREEVQPLEDVSVKSHPLGISALAEDIVEDVSKNGIRYNTLKGAIYRIHREERMIHFALTGGTPGISLAVAKKLFKELRKINYFEAKNIGKISADKLDAINLEEWAEKFIGGCMYIMEAPSLSNQSVQNLSALIEKYGRQIVLILEGSYDEMDSFLNYHKEFEQMITYKVKL